MNIVNSDETWNSMVAIAFATLVFAFFLVHKRGNQEQYTYVSAQVKAVNAQNTTLDAALKAQNATLKAQNAALETAINAQNTTLSAHTTALNATLNAHTAALNAQNVTLRAHTTTLNATLNVHTTGLNATLNAHTAALNAQNVTLSAHTTALNSQNAALNAMYDTLNDRFPPPIHSPQTQGTLRSFGNVLIEDAPSDGGA
jgi:cell division protein FtsB